MDRRPLFVVIPGIGSEARGEATEEFVRGVAAELRSAVPAVQPLLSLEDCTSSVGEAKTFLVPVASVEVGETDVRFAELYWDDLSSVKGSLVGLAIGLFQLILGVRHLLPPVAAVACSKPLVLISSFFFALLRGPILAMSFFAYACWLVAVAAHASLSCYSSLEDPQAVLEAHAHWIFSGFSVVLAAVALGWRRMASEASLARSWTVAWFIGVASASALAFPLSAPLLSSHPHIAAQLLVHLFAVPLRATWLLANLSILASIAVTLAQIPWIEPARRPSRFVFSLTMVVCIGFWITGFPLLLLASHRLVHGSLQIKGTEALLNKSIPTIGWLLTTLIVVLVAALAVWWRRSKHLSGHAEVPRLILSPQIGALLLTAPWILVPVFLLVSIDFLAQTPVGAAVGYLSRLLNGGVKGATVFVLLALFLMRSHIRQGLDLMLDIVNYFRPARTQENEAEVLPYSMLQFELRESILSRLDGILEHCSTPDGPRTELVLVAHSQGTVFALDFLAAQEHSDLLDRFERVRLVTMGSPYTHIYQYYFPEQFRDRRRDERIVRILGADGWLNLYRRGDYVGTVVTLATSPEHGKEPAIPKNVKIGVGGHSGYFADPCAVRKICGWVFPETDSARRVHGLRSDQM